MSRRKINLEKLANLYPPVAIYNAATGGSEGRKARRAARQERIRKDQIIKKTHIHVIYVNIRHEIMHYINNIN